MTVPTLDKDRYDQDLDHVQDHVHTQHEDRPAAHERAGDNHEAQNKIQDKLQDRAHDKAWDKGRDSHQPGALRTALESLKQWARRLRRDAVTLWFACRHPGTPLAAKLISVVVVAYALSPIDPIPDFIPVLGFVDEAIVLPLLIWAALKMIPATVLQECRTSGDAWMAREGKKPRSVWGAGLVIALWVAIAWGFWALVVAPRW